MMLDLDNERAYAVECARGTERWPGDLFPAARVEEHVARAALRNAWQAVAVAAEANATSALTVPAQYPQVPGITIRKLIDAAEALVPAVEKAAWAARRAENSLPPRHPKVNHDRH